MLFKKRASKIAQIPELVLLGTPQKMQKLCQLARDCRALGQSSTVLEELLHFCNSASLPTRFFRANPRTGAAWNAPFFGLILGWCGIFGTEFEQKVLFKKRASKIAQIPELALLGTRHFSSDSWLVSNFLNRI